MGTVSKAALCALVLAAVAKALTDSRAWTLPARRKAPMPTPSLQTRE